MTTSAQGSPPGSPEPPESAGPDPRRWLAFTVCLAAGFMVLLDGSMINVALPSVERSLDLTPTQVTWTVSGYILAFGLTLVTAGRLGDDHGRRKMFLIALVLFLVSSVFCGASQNGTWLLISRIARGATAGLLNPQIVGLIQQMFAGKERGKAFGFYAATVGISTAVGPLIGGGIMELAGPSSGWRYVFYVSLPIGIATLVLATRLLPKQHVARERTRLDLVGAALLGVVVVAIMLPVTQAGEAETEPSWWLLGVAAVGLAGFLAWERRLELGGRHPLVKLNLLKTRTYSAGALTGFCFFAAQPSIFILCQIYFQRGLHYSPLQAAMATMSYAIGSAVAAVVGGRIVHLFGRWLIVGGALVTTVGLGLTAMLAGSGTDGTTLPLAGSLLLAGLGAGFVIAPNQTMVMSEIPRREGGTAAGVYQTGLRVGSSIGVPLAMTLYFSTLQEHRGDVAVAVGQGLTVTTVIFAVALLVSLASVLLFGRHGAATETESPTDLAAVASPSAR
ncbi:MFS transporter [Streptomyces sp. NPDC091292]|uniref:MFS transporter n=1 Tax=Streptomyces sp. NPDC091292 TaxID=3365991 RepID=UPI0037F7BF51